MQIAKHVASRGFLATAQGSWFQEISLRASEVASNIVTHENVRSRSSDNLRQDVYLTLY